MQTLGGLGLMAALVLCYMLYFRSQPAETGAETDSRAIAHSVYKTDLDRAHQAAHQMQAANKEVASE